MYGSGDCINNVVCVYGRCVVDSMEIREVLEPILERINNESFINTYKATDEECLGMLLSKFTEWNGLAILTIARYALEDANFHSECEEIDKLIDNLLPTKQKSYPAPYLQRCPHCGHDNGEPVSGCKVCNKSFVS